MSDLETLRCSRLPAAFNCAASVRLPILSVEDDRGDAGNVGTSVHEALSVVVEAGVTRIADLGLPEICHRWGVSADEVAPLVYAGIDCWAQIKDSFAGAFSEGSLSATVHDVLITGHVDAMAIDLPRKRIHLLDWKSGRLDSDYREQILGYLALALIENPGVDEAHGFVVWLRERDVERYSMTRAQLSEWMDRLRRDVIHWDGNTFRAGPHCRYCPRSSECPALIARAKRDFQALMPPADESLGLAAEKLHEGIMSAHPIDIFTVMDRIATVQFMIDHFKEAVRIRLIKDGPIEAPKRKLELVAQNQREIVTLEAWPLIQARLEDEDIAECVKISITSVEAAVAKKAGKGKGAAAKRDLAAELEKAGAVKIKTIQRQKETRT